MNKNVMGKKSHCVVQRNSKFLVGSDHNANMWPLTVRTERSINVRFTAVT